MEPILFLDGHLGNERQNLAAAGEGQPRCGNEIGWGEDEKISRIKNAFWAEFGEYIFKP